MKKLITYFANQSLIVNILSVGLLIAGLIFITSARREAFPNIDFDWVKVTAVYPGATAEDVEKHVTLLIEDELREIDGIEALNSRSLESLSYITIKLDPDLDNKDKTISDITNAIDRIDDFPEDAEDPLVVELNMHQQPVLNISVLNKNGIENDRDEFELRRHAKILEDRLLNINGVARIVRTGYREREMIVEADPDLLDKYHVAMNDITMALSKKNLNFPGGIVNDGNEEVLIRTIGEVESARDISNVLIRANDMGNWVRVSDVARVKDTFEEEEVINKAVGYKAVTLTVLKKESADIIELVEKVEKEIARFQRNLPENYDIVKTDDLSYHVKKRLNVLTNNGIIGFSLVVIVLFITLGWRIAFVTALGLPLAFSGTFIWMGCNNITINLMSMFGLIMVLGMLVDDAIIVAENIYRHIEEGTGLKDAVINGTFEVVTPVAGTILTTIAAFAPLMFMSGIMGKFIWTLPAVVSVALAASWVESMFILPSHVKDVEGGSNGAVSRVKERRWDPLRFWREKYYGVLRVILKLRYAVLFLIFVLLIGSMVFAKNHVKFILFPGGGIEAFIVKAEAPPGTTIEQMSDKLSDIERVIYNLPPGELKNFISSAGIIQEEPNDPFKKIGSRYGMVKVYLTPDEDRDRRADEITDAVRQECGDMKGFEKLEFKLIRHGPPVGRPVSVLVKGEKFEVLKEIAAKYKEYLSGIEGLKDIKDNFEENKRELRIYVDEKIAAQTGISVFDIASTVRACYEGTVATSIKRSEEEIDIRVIFPEKHRDNLNSLKKIKIANRRGNLIPLSSVADFEKSSGISVITRKDWKRGISVTAEIDEHARENVTSVAVNTQMMEDFADIEERYPGYTVDYEGEFKDSQESVENLSNSFLIALLIIYFILVSLFRSLLHPFVIITVIPFTFIGIIWTFYFHGLPLSFLSMMGVVGLTGVVINDSIVYVDFINKERKRGNVMNDAILKAGVTRLRPIFLTTITTFFGLIPTAYGIGGNDTFLKPMALSMSWGLIFGTMITLFVTPVVYYIFSDARAIFAGFINKIRETEKYRDKISDDSLGLQEQNPDRRDNKAKKRAKSGENRVKRGGKSGSKKNY